MHSLPEVPEEEVADLAVRQGSVQQEFGQLAVQVGLVFEHLHKLQKVLEKLIIPAEKEGCRRQRPGSSQPRTLLEKTGVCVPRGSTQRELTLASSGT